MFGGKQAIQYEEVNATNPTSCTINYFYWISSRIQYGSEELLRDNETVYPYIIRSDYEDNGYLSFLIPILHNSTYTLVVEADANNIMLPSSYWIDTAISFLKENPDEVASCATTSYGTPPVHIARECLMMRSIHLRYLWTKTEMQRNDIPAMSFISMASQCLFGSFQTPFPHAIQLSSWFRCWKWGRPCRFSSSYSPTTTFLHEFHLSCRHALHIEPMNCVGRRPDDGSVLALLSQWKRTYVVDQFAQLQESSVPITEYILFQNGQHQDYQDMVKNTTTMYHIWATNWMSPFFLRHLLPLLSTCYYHIVFDDDIIPQVDTVKELLQPIQARNAVTGVRGRIILSSTYYPIGMQFDCIDCKVWEEDQVVDYVIQVYAKKYTHSKVNWRYRPYTHRNGDDMHNSLSNHAECGILAIMPKFSPTGETKHLGNDAVASWRTKTHNIVRPLTYRSWLSAGFPTIRDDSIHQGFPEHFRRFTEEYMNQTHRYFPLERRGSGEKMKRVVRDQ